MIILCVTGSIAATESIKLARELKRNDVEVKCFMSEAACDIITVSYTHLTLPTN